MIELNIRKITRINNFNELSNNLKIRNKDIIYANYFEKFKKTENLVIEVCKNKKLYKVNEKNYSKKELLEEITRLMKELDTQKETVEKNLQKDYKNIIKTIRENNEI